MRNRIGRIGSERIVLQATTGTMLEVSERVWGKGELTDGGTISYKEDYEVYIQKPPFPRVGSKKGKPFDQWKRPPINLPGDSRKVKGGWYATYLGAKGAVDRADLPFELTGDMRKSWFGGVTPNPTIVDDYTVVIDMDQKNADKARGLAQQKGEFLLLNDQEIQNHHKRVADLWAGINR